MAFYESVFIVNQEVSSFDIDKIKETFTEIVEENNGAIIKTEYWGIRNLAYKIKKVHKKAHYIFIGCETTPSVIQKIRNKMKFNEKILRFVNIKVQLICNEPSPILKNKSADNEEIVDMTVNKDCV